MQEGFVVLATHTGGEIKFGVLPGALANLTATVGDPPTYAALSSLPCATAGYQSAFDAWKASGIIS